LPSLGLEHAPNTTTSPAQGKAGAELPHSTQTPWRTAPAHVTPTHYKIDVAFEPDRHFLRATAAVTLRIEPSCDPGRGGPPPAPSAVEECPPDSTGAAAIEFELNRHLTLRSVTDAQGRSLEFIRSPRLTSHKLLVRLAEPVVGATAPCGRPTGIPPEAGQTHRPAPTDSLASATPRSESPAACITLTFTYDGALPPAPLDYITPDGILLRDESRWYPATDLVAFTTNMFEVAVPRGWFVLSSGQYSLSENSNGFQVYRWETGSVSVRVLAGQVIGAQTSFVEEPLTTVKSGHKQFVHYLLPEKNSHALIRSIAGPFMHFREVIGDVATMRFRTGLGFFGAHGVIGYSAPGFLIVSKDVVKWHGHRGLAPEFLPHEIAHQWFPIEVTLRSEEDGWLAESLAEYLAWRYLEEKQPDDARRMVERAVRSTLARLPLRPLRLGLKLFALEDWDATHATLYQRGMLVWRTLETVIDRERVDRALREYYARHRGGPASIADFRRICEEISGRDLTWFFDYYINGVELPTITLRRLPSVAPGELAGEIHISNVPHDFQVRVELRITTREGALNHSLATRGAVTPFAINVPAPVTAIELDPRLRILRVTEPARRHRAQLAALEQQSDLEGTDSSDETLRGLIRMFESVIALDPENLAANHQLYYLKIGRLQLRLQQYDAAWKSLDRALALESLNPMATDLHRAWARVFRARAALARGDRAAARREIDAGLALKSPALETPVTWPDTTAQPISADAALRALLL